MLNFRTLFPQFSFTIFRYNFTDFSREYFDQKLDQISANICYKISKKIHHNLHVFLNEFLKICVQKKRAELLAFTNHFRNNPHNGETILITLVLMSHVDRITPITGKQLEQLGVLNAMTRITPITGKQSNFIFIYT